MAKKQFGRIAALAALAGAAVGITYFSDTNPFTKSWKKISTILKMISMSLTSGKARKNLRREITFP